MPTIGFGRMPSPAGELYVKFTAITRAPLFDTIIMEDVINLFYFIDWLMKLSEEMEESFWAEMHQYEEGKKMEYITSVDKERGKE